MQSTFAAPKLQGFESSLTARNATSTAILTRGEMVSRQGKPQYLGQCGGSTVLRASGLGKWGSGGSVRDVGASGGTGEAED
jgi:hypothetical protein